jgi:mono/diheme cytochrome c family protein
MNAVRAFLLMLMVSPIGATYAQTVTSASDGVYTLQQASRGKALYAARCVSCHGRNLRGSLMAPPLVGTRFLRDWTPFSLGELFHKILATMPAANMFTGLRDTPLTKDQTAVVVAFLLQENKFPAGKVKLVTDMAVLRRIRIQRIN